MLDDIIADSRAAHPGIAGHLWLLTQPRRRSHRQQPL